LKKVGDRVRKVDSSFWYCILSSTKASKSSVGMFYWQMYPVRLSFLFGGNTLWISKFCLPPWQGLSPSFRTFKVLLVIEKMRWGLCPSGRQRLLQAQDLLSPRLRAF
jgi:hypothetical protein